MSTRSFGRWLRIRLDETSVAPDRYFELVESERAYGRHGRGGRLLYLSVTIEAGVAWLSRRIWPGLSENELPLWHDQARAAALALADSAHARARRSDGGRGRWARCRGRCVQGGPTAHESHEQSQNVRSALQPHRCVKYSGAKRGPSAVGFSRSRRRLLRTEAGSSRGAVARGRCSEWPPRAVAAEPFRTHRDREPRLLDIGLPIDKLGEYWECQQEVPRADSERDRGWLGPSWSAPTDGGSMAP